MQLDCVTLVSCSVKQCMHETSGTCCRAEFKEIRLLGTGNFSKVYLAQHRLDGVNYALKRSARPVCSDAVKRQWIQVYTTYICIVACVTRQRCASLPRPYSACGTYHVVVAIGKLVYLASYAMHV